MSQPIKFPDPEKVKQRAQRMREICAVFDEQIAILDRISAQIEAENQKQPFYIYSQRRKQEREAAQEKLHTIPASIESF
jgi:dTDP-4-amino-4,6-dideoxygalactose transaminase